MLVAHYFDDNAQIEISRLSPVSKTMMVRLAGYSHIELSPQKRQRFMPMQTFLGHFNDFTTLRTDGAVIFAPKLGAREKAVSLIEDTLRKGHFTPGEASKMRGILQWLDGHCGQAMQGGHVGPRGEAILREEDGPRDRGQAGGGLPIHGHRGQQHAGPCDTLPWKGETAGCRLHRRFSEGERHQVGHPDLPPGLQAAVRVNRRPGRGH